MNEKLEALMEQLCAPMPPEAYETDSSRGFELTGVKSIYVIERLNEVFGPCGTGWAIQNVRHTEADRWVLADLELIYRLDDGEWSIPIPSSGDSNVVKGRIGDAKKGAVSDAIKKAASMLGVAIEAYKGLLGRQKPQRTRQRAPATPKKAAPAKKADTSNGEKGPKAVKVWLLSEAEKGTQRPINSKDVQQIAPLLNNVLGGDDERKVWLEWTYGVDSAKKLTGAQKDVLWKTMQPAYDPEQSAWTPTGDAGERLAAAIRVMYEEAVKEMPAETAPKGNPDAPAELEGVL